jgi:hypothetical protein
MSSFFGARRSQASRIARHYRNWLIDFNKQWTLAVNTML